MDRMDQKNLDIHKEAGMDHLKKTDDMQCGKQDKHCGGMDSQCGKKNEMKIGGGCPQKGDCKEGRSCHDEEEQPDKRRESDARNKEM